MACDLAAVILIGGALAAFYNFLTNVTGQSPDTSAGMMIPRLLFWLVPGLGQLILVWQTGVTVGEHAVRRRPATPLRHLDGPTKVIRWGAGIGGFCQLQLAGSGVLSLLGLLFAGASFASVLFNRQHRGLAYVATDLELSDDRAHPEVQRRG